MTMRSLEADSLGPLQSEVGQWWTMTEDNVRRIAEAVKGGTSCLEMLPSYNEVMRQGDLRIEVLSLKEVRATDSSILMSHAEVRFCIQKNWRRGVGEQVSLPGKPEASAFMRIFEGQEGDGFED